MARPQTLSDAGEDTLVAMFKAMLPASRGVVVGIGDDCAVLRGARSGWYQLFKTDCIVEGVHFSPSTPPRQVGRKALARAVSDIAAMAGTPRHALVTLILPKSRRIAWLRGLYEGLNAAAREFGVGIVGGETSATPASGKAAAISIALTGEVRKDRCPLRSGGRAGDLLFVTGRLGGSLASGRHLRFNPRIAEAQWLAQRFPIHALMDLSDGLAMDLPRLAACSGTGYHVHVDRLPRSRGCDLPAALGDGEDYELLFTVSRRHADSLPTAWRRRFPKLPLTEIGHLTADPRETTPDLSGGWDHFS